MSTALKRQAGYGIALIGALFGLWVSQGNGLLEAGFALCAAGAVLWHIFKSDEVELLLSMRAAACAFATLLGLAIASVPLGVTLHVAAIAHLLWAVMVGCFLVFWIIFRVRLG